jgi:hypothetical protein
MWWRTQKDSLIDSKKQMVCPGQQGEILGKEKIQKKKNPRMHKIWKVLDIWDGVFNPHKGNFHPILYTSGYFKN